MLVLCRVILPVPQSGASRPSQLWLWVAALLVLGWLLNRWPQASPVQPAGAGPQPARVLASVQPSPARPPHFRHAHPWPSDLGTLIATARESASVGSHYRALRTLDFCARQAHYMLEDRPPGTEDAVFSDPRQAAALLQIRALCARDEGSESLDYYALAEEGLARPDPILSLALRLERLSAAPHESADLQDAAMRRDLITRIFAMQEPALLSDLANELSLLSPRLTFTVAGVPVDPEAHDALIAALRDLGCGAAGCFDARELLLRCAAAAQCDPATDAAPSSWQRARFLALLQFSGGRALDFSYRPTA